MSAPWDRPPPEVAEIETDDDTFLTVERWPRDVFRPHYHEEFNWIVPMRPGRVVVEVEDRQHELDHNRWICVFPRTAHKIAHVSDDCEVLSLFIPGAAMERAFRTRSEVETIGERCIVGAAGAVAQGLALAWGELRFARREPDPVDRALEEFVTGWLWRFFRPRIEAVDDWSLRLRVRLGRDGETIAAFLEAHLAEAPFPWDPLAEALGVSRRTLQRQFAAELGCSTSDVLASMRIERARALLADPSRPVGDVALASGFASQSHFSTAFKTATGSTPTAFRRELARGAKDPA
jgi:AraC-like DNA-binding protein